MPLHIVLRGIEKFRILDEDTSREYRVARIQPLPEIASDADRQRLNTASPINVIGTPRSAAEDTVHLPVPFCSAASRIVSST